MNPTKQEETEEFVLEAALSRLTLINDEKSTATSNKTTHLDLSAAISTLAQASRTNTSVRSRLSDPEILHGLLHFLSTTLNNRSGDIFSVIEALRCVGNACIDNDATRAIVIASPERWAHACLSRSDDEMVRTSIKVLYNLCVDYEAAQRWGYAERLQDELIYILGEGRPRVEMGEAERGLAFELLFWITNQRPPPPTPSSQGADSVAKATMTTAADRRIPRLILHELLRLPFLYAQALDVEDFAMVIETCLTYLRDPVVQSQVLEYRLVPYVWRMLSDNEQKILHLERENTKSEMQMEEVKLLIPLTSSLTWCLSDIAAGTVDLVTATDRVLQFDESFIHGLVELVVFLGADDESQLTKRESWRTVNGLLRRGVTERISHVARAESRSLEEHDPAGSQPFAQELEETSKKYEDDLIPNSPRMLVVACQFLANVLWGEESQPSDQIWMRHDLYASLWSAIARMPDAELLHAASGLLARLTRCPLDLRQVMGQDENAMPALQRLCRHGTPQVKQDGIKLLRALGKDCPTNQARFADLAKEVLESTSTDTTKADDSKIMTD